MIGLFGLCDTSVHDAHRVLAQAGEIKTELLMPGDALSKKVKCYLIPSCGMFLRRAEELMDWNGVVIIFDAPVRCDGLIGLTMLDVKEREIDRIRKEALTKGV